MEARLDDVGGSCSQPDHHKDERLCMALNKGHEAAPPLSFLIDSDDSLPWMSSFVHGHFLSWHQPDSMVQLIAGPNRTSAARVDYMSLRCDGCLHAAAAYGHSSTTPSARGPRRQAKGDRVRNGRSLEAVVARREAAADAQESMLCAIGRGPKADDVRMQEWLVKDLGPCEKQERTVPLEEVTAPDWCWSSVGARATRRRPKPRTDGTAELVERVALPEQTSDTEAHNTAAPVMLTPTLHIEVMLKCKAPATVQALHQQIVSEVAHSFRTNYAQVHVGTRVECCDGVTCFDLIEAVDVVDYTGPPSPTGFYDVEQVQLDVVAYALRTDAEARPRRRISQNGEPDDMPQARVLPLPNVALKDDWDSLIYAEALPAQLLRYLTRMLGVMKQPALNLSTFNWNRLCLLHGPAGSGKSTLCRALAQKLSIRLCHTFPHAVLVEVNANAMLSKYFGESGKLIGNLFEKIHSMAQAPNTLVCVVMDEVESIASSREKANAGGECSDGMRATNQLLTALDRLRALPNIIVLCTSNLLGAIDPAFLDRVDIKQLIPSPSPAAVYNIFRSCLNELVRASLVDASATDVSARSSPAKPLASAKETTNEGPESSSLSPAPTSSPETWTLLTTPTIPTLPEMHVCYYNQPESSCRRVWALAQKCEGLSGRTLRRLPILGLAMYTWGGNCSMDEAVSALAAAVEQEMMAKQNPTTVEEGKT